MLEYKIGDGVFSFEKDGGMGIYRKVRGEPGHRGTEGATGGVNSHKQSRSVSEKTNDVTESAPPENVQATSAEDRSEGSITASEDEDDDSEAESNGGLLGEIFGDSASKSKKEDIQLSLSEDEITMPPSPWWDYILSRTLFVAVAIIGILAAILTPSIFNPEEVWEDQARAVSEALDWAWGSYKTHAWGHDTLLPLSRSYNDSMHMALTMVDNLDTLVLLEQHAELREASRWVGHNFDPDRMTGDVDVYEVMTRVIGGLLSAHRLTGDTKLLDKAVALATKVLPAFTQSGLPHERVNLHLGNVSSRHSHVPLKKVMVLLELRALANLTEDDRFRGPADRLERALFAAMEYIKPDGDSVPGIPASHLDRLTGRFCKPSGCGTENGDPRGDPAAMLDFVMTDETLAYYETMLMLWMQGGRADDAQFSRYVAMVRGIALNLVESTERNFTYVGEIREGRFHAQMQHAVCALPGLLALGYIYGLKVHGKYAAPELARELNQHVKLAEKLMGMCVELHTVTPTGLVPEAVWFEDSKHTRRRLKRTNPGGDAPKGDTGIRVRRNATRSQLSPWTVKSLYIMHELFRSADGEVGQQYQEWGWSVFLGMETVCRLPEGGYHAMGNVFDEDSAVDLMPSSFMSQTLKYLYLLFKPGRRRFLTNNIFTPEGHVLGVLDPDQTS